MIEKAAHVTILFFFFFFTIFWNLARNPEKNSSKIRRKNAKFEFFAIELMKFINSIAKKTLTIFDEKILMTKRTERMLFRTKRMLFRRISSVNRCRQNILKEVSRTHPQPRKSRKRQRVRRSKIATRAQHSRAAPVAQVYIAELG